jgi:hypothetical protein
LRAAGVSAGAAGSGIELGGGAWQLCRRAQALVAAAAGRACEQVEELDVSGRGGFRGVPLDKRAAERAGEGADVGHNQRYCVTGHGSLRCHARNWPNWGLGVVVFQPGARSER